MALDQLSETDLHPKALAESYGKVFAEFDARTQDSGNVSYGVAIKDKKFFMKHAPPEVDAFLPWQDRVELLRNAVQISTSCQHRSLPELLNVIESPSGPILIYQWVEGELLGGKYRKLPDSGHQRFLQLPVEEITSALDVIFELHTELAAANLIASDFYDGALIYNFKTSVIYAMDLDNYQRGRFKNTMGRMFGSERFMAPEEFQLGDWITEQTTVYNMGRSALVFLGHGSSEVQHFRGSSDMFDVVSHACRPSPEDRYQSMAEFLKDWRSVTT